MRSVLFAMVAAMCEAFKLTNYNGSGSSNFADDKVRTGWSWDFDWTYGIGAPIRWARYTDWHTAIAAHEELYTRCDYTFTYYINIYNDDAVNLFGVALTPYVEVFDINFVDAELFYWPQQAHNMDPDDPIGEHCIWIGWWWKILYFRLSLSVNQRECGVGLHDFIFDNGEFACSTTTYSLTNVKTWSLKPFSNAQSGMHESKWNTCMDNAAYTQRSTEVRTLKEGWKQYLKGAKSKDDPSFEESDNEEFY